MKYKCRQCKREMETDHPFCTIECVKEFNSQVMENGHPEAIITLKESAD